MSGKTLCFIFHIVIAEGIYFINECPADGLNLHRKRFKTIISDDVRSGIFYRSVDDRVNIPFLGREGIGDKSSFQFYSGHDTFHQIVTCRLIAEEVIVVILIAFDTIPVLNRHT